MLYVVQLQQYLEVVFCVILRFVAIDNWSDCQVVEMKDFAVFLEAS